MITAIIYVAAIGLFIGAVALVGAGWNHWQWVRDGRASFSNGEQLQIDLLRAQGRTLTGARREVMRQRNSPYWQTMQSVREVDDFLMNPMQESELRQVIAAHALVSVKTDDTN